jgi:predicted site-specific integrase-resolvase
MRIERYTLEEVCLLLDAPAWAVERWCRAALIPGARHERGEWAIPDRGLSLFLRRAVEPLYTVEQVAGILALEVETVRGYIKARRLPVVKLGVAKSAPVRVCESELRRWIRA